MEEHTDALTRLGGWLFRHRTIVPLPLALAVLVTPAEFASTGPAPVAAGLSLVAAGEAIRLWGVRHIGAISRTRSGRLGPLVDSGPFALVRNPLYLGNIALWAGFALAAGLVWLAPAFVIILALEYHAIVRWEERLLEQRLGDIYRRYAAAVPRWVPSIRRQPATDRGPAGAFSWRATIHSERGTLLAIAVGFLVLWIKA